MSLQESKNTKALNSIQVMMVPHVYHGVMSGASQAGRMNECMVFLYFGGCIGGGYQATWVCQGEN